MSGNYLWLFLLVSTLWDTTDSIWVSAAYKENGWNELVVIAKGPTLIQKINGVVFSQLTDHDEKYSTAKGWIAFQDHGKGTKVEFKNIRIRIDK